MPFGPYDNFEDCVSKNGDKSSPEGFCSWLHHKITGSWPSGMTADKYPEAWLSTYDAALVAQKPEKEAYEAATKAAEAAGYELTRFGWIKQFQSPKTKTVTGVKIFASGTWTDSGGTTTEFTDEDLDKIVDAFTAGVPAVVPIKCGHTSDDFNRRIAEALDVPVEIITGDHGHGQAKLGSMISLQRKGNLLIAAFDKVPESIANLIEGGQYATVSVEIEDTVGDFGPVITGVALLGAEEPAVDAATLERALVFGGSRKGARVLSFKVGDEIPTLKGKLKAVFAQMGDIIEKLVGKTDSAPGGDKDPAALQKGKPPKDWWDRCSAKVSGWPGVADVDAFCGSVWFHDDPIPASSFASEKAANQAEIKFKKGESMKTLPKGLQGKKPEEIRAMTIKDLAAKFQEDGEVAVGEVTVGEIVDALPEEPAKGVADIAIALGLDESATIDDILAAIEALKAGETPPPETPPAEIPPAGEMKKEMKKSADRIAVLENEKRVRDWEEKTRAFNAIPGTAHEHAVKLADIEAKAGKDAAESQYAALESANKMTAEAMKVVGTTRSGTPTDFDNEVKKYQKDNPKADKAEAIKAVSKARPDLYFARPERQ